jgi:hypothetical protein
VDNDLFPIYHAGNTVDPASVLRMAQRDKPVVTGIACGHHPQRGVFACVVMLDDKGQGRWITHDDTEAIPIDGVSKIENCGSGFMMVRRDVLETLWSNAMVDREQKVNEMLDELTAGALSSNPGAFRIFASKWVSFIKELRHAHDDDGLPFTVPQSVLTESIKTGWIPRSEDICFTDRVRHAGYDLFVDWSVHCAHMKDTALFWDPERRKDIDAASWKITEEHMAVSEVG